MPSKDGTVYLAEVLYDNGTIQWELIHWGRPIGMSDPRGIKKWCDQSGFALKLHSILQSVRLSVVSEYAQ